MPQLDSGGGGAGGAGGGDDLGAPDELLAFQDEGEEQDKSRDSAAGPERDLAELKSSLVNESEGAAEGSGIPGTGAGARSEAEVGAEALGREHTSQRLFPDKLPESLEDGLKAPGCSSGMYKETVYSAFNLLMHYPPASGAGQHPQPQPPLNKANQPTHSVPQLSPLYEHFSSPHPTPAPSDINQKQGVHRPLQTPDLSGFYSLTSSSMGQLPHTVSWPSPPLYPLSPSCGYRQHFPAPTAAPGTPYPRFTHPSLMLGSGVPGHPAAIPHPAIVPTSGKQELQPYDRSLKTQAESKAEKEAKKPTIKKPLNAFMLYMKEMRAKVIAECTLKESAAINQILGRRWHALSREEQAKYYELARKERQLHMQLYPGWSARDNYGKKKRRSREKHQESTTGGKRNAFELLASPVESAPTSPRLSTILSLPAPGPPQAPHSTLQNTQVQQQESQRQAA
ncbi:transcription factor 7 isoform X3 [Marmota flaviventris]|uniref:transcription factor 7 isoform X3 n=1 Tax=Marmota flaviventris TaxID=93162 RepID=UPI000FFF8928|nr:transcription factor 7 isoform X3 [Marmota flaviventris]